MRDNQNDSDRDQAFAAELASFEACLAESLAAPVEEAVPAEMMQVFSDEQWPALRFEFQPSLRVFSARRDVVGWSREAHGSGPGRVPEAGDERRWLIFRRDAEQLVRPLAPAEREALGLALSGMDFATIAASLWPDGETGTNHHRLTEILLGWLAEGLVIDAGVPLPEDAELID